MWQQNFLKSRLKQALVLCGVLLIGFTSLSPSVAALTQAQKDTIKSGARYFNTEEDGATACGPGGGVSKGNGAPDGAQFPNLDPPAMAKAIDTWVVKENPNTTLKGLGATIVASAKNSNVSPFLIATIARKESSMADPNDFNVKNGNNAFGRTATEDQPNFKGSKLWYKWTSVKASVDYTAPENQGAKGGGDMASYLRYQYGDQIDNDNLIALFLIYAPPNENNTELYIKQIQGWIDELVALTTGSGSTGSIGSATDECAGAVAGDAVKTAINYAWPDYYEAPYCKEKPSYKLAIEAAYKAGQYTGGTCTIGGTWIGVDCGAFTTRVMIDSGADPGFNYGGKLSNGAGNTTAQQKYLDEQVKAGKYQKLSGVTGTSQLQPGDIAIKSTHTYIFVGSQPGFNGNSASSSIGGADNDTWRAPMASIAYGFGEFDWYRLISK